MTKKDPISSIKMRIDSQSHIGQIEAAKCRTCESRPCLMFCPSQVFAWADEQLQISYERCVECGACLRGCPRANIHWDYPRAGYGIMHDLST